MKRFVAVASLFTWVGLILVAGCSSKRDQITDPARERLMAHVDAIVKSTGGDWTKLSPADHDFLVQQVGKGQEMPARMVFYSRAGSYGNRRPAGGPP
ncbi:MAG TPA: hypothetical protein VGS41_00245 [Chthonomonadales bacterium]|nr:hypothetical protein [Chthonomonadales bacterium]